MRTPGSRPHAPFRRTGEHRHPSIETGPRTRGAALLSFEPHTAGGITAAAVTPSSHSADPDALDQVKRTLRLYRHLDWTFTADDLDGNHLPH